MQSNYFFKKACLAIAAAVMGLPVNAATHTQEENDLYEHLIMSGQSLSTGWDWDATPNLSINNVAGNYMLGDQIWVNYGNPYTNTGLIPLAGTPSKDGKNTECPLFGAANHIQLKIPGKYIATSVGTDSKSVEELSKNYPPVKSNLYITDFLKALQRAAALKNVEVHCPAIFWMQGETNYISYGTGGMPPGTKPVFDKNEYKELMVKLKNDMQADVKLNYKQTDNPLFITYQVGGEFTSGRELPIGMAQLEASNEYEDIVCAGPVYPVTNAHDGQHLDANGYRWYGEMLGKVYYKTKISGENFKPLQPKKVSRDALDDRKIIIQFLVPVMPLVLDDKTLKKENAYGFEVYSNRLSRPIDKVEIIDDCVVLTCTSSLPLTHKIEVVYAGGKTKGKGNLRDSDDYKAFFNYEDLESKGSVRPSFEPKGADGKVIYDKPYPLYNFCVAFYYAIPPEETVGADVCAPLDERGWQATASYSGSAHQCWGSPNDVLKGSAWSACSAEGGVEFMVDMQKILKFDQIIMINKGDDWGRRLLEYELYVSNNGKDWGANAVVSGSFRNAKEGDPLIIELPETQTARHFKIVYLGNGYQWSINELWATSCDTPVGTFNINCEQIVAGYYDMLGRKLSSEPSSGIYIIKYADGTTEKIVK